MIILATNHGIILKSFSCTYVGWFIFLLYKKIPRKMPQMISCFIIAIVWLESEQIMSGTIDEEEQRKCIRDNLAVGVEEERTCDYIFHSKVACILLLMWLPII